MILSFGDQGTEDLYHGKQSSKARKTLPRALLTTAGRKFDMLDAAEKLEDLKIPPGNHLESLKGNYKGFYSIRINNQYRMVFAWKGSGAEKVRITDYH